MPAHFFKLEQFDWNPVTRTLTAFQSKLFMSRHSRIADEIIITGQNHKLTFFKHARVGNVVTYRPDVDTPVEYQDITVIYYGP